MGDKKHLYQRKLFLKHAALLCVVRGRDEGAVHPTRVEDSAWRLPALSQVRGAFCSFSPLIIHIVFIYILKNVEQINVLLECQVFPVEN